MEKFIPLSVPNFIGNELKYVTEAIKTEWVSTGGAYVTKFEESISDYLSVEKAVACQSGTAGLHLSLIAAGVNENHEVIVPTVTFIAAVNPVRYIKAEPVFMDCDDSLNMDLDKLEEFCQNECEFESNHLVNKKTDKVIKALVIVHVFGNTIDMERLMKIANKYNLKVIEDATEALGTFYLSGKYKDLFLGTIGDFGVYSFNGNKIITTGGGGMVVAKNNKDLEKIKYLSTQAKDDPLYYQHDEIGYNYRMTNLQAALGIAQLESLEDLIQIKNKNYEIYYEGIESIKGLEMIKFNENIRSNKWFYSILVNEEIFGLNRDDLLKKLSESKIQSRPLWGLIHKQRPYIMNESYDINKANYYVDHLLNIPCSTNLEELDIKRVLKILKKLSEGQA